MNYRRYHFFVIFAIAVSLLSFSPSYCWAQDDDSFQLDDFSSLSTDDFLKIELPSINVLIENSKLRPEVRALNAQEQIQESLLSREKRGWMDFFSMGTGYTYGNVGMYSSYSDLTTPMYSSSSTGTNRSWQIGVSANFNLGTIFDLKGRIKRQKLTVEVIRLQKLTALDEQRSKIIELYAKTQLQLALLRGIAETYILTKTNDQVIQQNFLSAKVKIADLTAAKQNLAAVNSSYETSKSELIQSLLKLELMTNTKILKSDKK